MYVDYRRIASAYDRDRMRRKTVDPHLVAFAERRGREDLDVLDIGCGTGSQLLADLQALPSIRAVGVDGSEAMLEEARSKSVAITWIRADVAHLPLPAESADYATMQFVLHQLPDPGAALSEARRVLRPGGQLVITTLDPTEQPRFLVYHYWPEALALDRARFVSRRELVDLCISAGFAAPAVTASVSHPDVAYVEALETARQRSGSQLALLPDHVWRAGVDRLEADARADPHGYYREEICLVTVVAAL